MAASFTTKEKIGKAILWIGIVGFFTFFIGNFVMDYVLLNKPLIPQQSTGNLVKWAFQGHVRCITETENLWQEHLWEPTFFMFCVVAVGVYLTPEKNEKWPRKFKPKS